jgi:hypothetical protein
VTIHVSPDGAAWKTADLLGHFVAVGSPTPAWRECVEGYVYNAGAWRLLFAVQPDPPTNFRATNIGSYTNRVMLNWDAPARAVSYKLYYRVGTTGTLNHFASPTTNSWDVTAMGYDTNHEFWVESIDSGGRPSKTMAGPVRVRTGHEKSSIPGGRHDNVVGWMDSQKRFRQGRWDYDDSQTTDPPVLFWGYYDTAAYAYWTFMEMSFWNMRQVIKNHIGAAGDYPYSITCEAAWIEYDRYPAGSAQGQNINVEIQLGNGISYGAAPTHQGNRGVVTIGPTGGRRRTGIWANWFQAIYQQHAAYNGLLIPPYSYAGARQTYGGMYGTHYSNSPTWGMAISWPEIVLVAQANTAAW